MSRGGIQEFDAQVDGPGGSIDVCAKAAQVELRPSGGEDSWQESAVVARLLRTHDAVSSAFIKLSSPARYDQSEGSSESGSPNADAVWTFRKANSVGNPGADIQHAGAKRNRADDYGKHQLAGNPCGREPQPANERAACGEVLGRRSANAGARRLLPAAFRWTVCDRIAVPKRNVRLDEEKDGLRRLASPG